MFAAVCSFAEVQPCENNGMGFDCCQPEYMYVIGTVVLTWSLEFTHFTALRGKESHLIPAIRQLSLHCVLAFVLLQRSNNIPETLLYVCM